MAKKNIVDLSKLNEINLAIENYFTENPSLTIVPVKMLMPAFIEAGVFIKDHKNGMPIRKILRELDKTDQLQQIPSVHTEKKGDDTYWYFVPSALPRPTTPYRSEEKKPESKRSTNLRSNSDETYVIDLCDSILGRKANRQKRFDYLLGDFHKDGKTRTKLPVDAFYQALQLVVEYKETVVSKKTDEELSADGPDKKEDSTDQNRRFTISGVTREEQREIYDNRKAEVFPEHDITLIVLSDTDFPCDPMNKIIRNDEANLEIIQNVLKAFVPSEDDKEVE
jgi:hypothetical protein